MGHRIAKHVLTSSDVLEHSTYYILDAQGNTMAVYEREVDEELESINFYQAEKHLYGSARLGVLHDSIELLGTINDEYDMSITNHVIGKVNYELSNHLGNVLSTISDKPMPHDNAGTVDYFMADIRNAQDYSPFGVTLSGRNFTLAGVVDSCRYGFQNQEKDDEIKGDGNSVNYKYRMHDPRIGRFFAIDPLASKYPYNSPYAFSENNVIGMVELEGLEAERPPQPGFNSSIDLENGVGNPKMSLEVPTLPPDPAPNHIHQINYPEVNGKQTITAQSQWQYDAGQNLWWPINRYVYDEKGKVTTTTSTLKGCVSNGQYSGTCTFARPVFYGATRFQHTNRDGVRVPVANQTPDEIARSRDGMSGSIKNVITANTDGRQNAQILTVNVSLNPAAYNNQDIVTVRDELAKTYLPSVINVILDPELPATANYSYNFSYSSDKTFTPPIAPVNMSPNQPQ